MLINQPAPVPRASDIFQLVSGVKLVVKPSLPVNVKVCCVKGEK